MNGVIMLPGGVFGGVTGGGGSENVQHKGGSSSRNSSLKRVLVSVCFPFCVGSRVGLARTGGAALTGNVANRREDSSLKQKKRGEQEIRCSLVKKGKLGKSERRNQQVLSNTKKFTHFIY